MTKSRDCSVSRSSLGRSPSQILQDAVEKLDMAERRAIFNYYYDPHRRAREICEIAAKYCECFIFDLGDGVDEYGALFQALLNAGYLGPPGYVAPAAEELTPTVSPSITDDLVKSKFKSKP